MSAERQVVVDRHDQMPELMAILDEAQVGDEILFCGKVSQSVSKAFNAYHKTSAGRAKSRLALGTSFGALALGPVGAVVSLVSSTAMFSSSRQLRELKKSYQALPYAAEIEDLALRGFSLERNTGDAVLLKKVR